MMMKQEKKAMAEEYEVSKTVEEYLEWHMNEAWEEAEG